MKQVTVLCSSDLTPLVRDALIRSGIEGFVFVPDAVAVQPGAALPDGRPPQWAAAVFLAPVPDERVAALVGSLAGYAEECEVKPCLRVLVTALEEVH